MGAKKALITGYTGQDGTFLTEHLLSEGYIVIGLTRRISTEPPQRIRGRFDFSEQIATGQLIFEQGDLLSVDSLIRIIKKHQPKEIYNLAAQSDVGISFKEPESTIQADFLGVVNLITALEAVGGDDWRMYQASTSEMFGNVPHDADADFVFNEDSRFNPNSPYAIAKTAAHHYCTMKREHGRFISCGILFNHESEIRGGNFVTQKIARTVAELAKAIHTDSQWPQLRLGNLDSVRDWGYAGDYVMAMHKILLADQPDDFVVATGETHTVRQFVEAALKTIGKTIEWDRAGYGYGSAREVGVVDGKIFVSVDPEFYRPTDVTYLRGDSSNARDILGWKPYMSFEGLVSTMVTNQLERAGVVSLSEN